MDDTLVFVDKENHLPVDKEVTLSASSLLDRIKGHQKLFADDATVALQAAVPAAVHGTASEGARDATSGGGMPLSLEAEDTQPRPQLIEAYRQKTLELGSDRGAEALSVWLRYAQLQTCALAPLATPLYAVHLALCIMRHSHPPRGRDRSPPLSPCGLQGRGTDRRRAAELQVHEAQGDRRGRRRFLRAMVPARGWRRRREPGARHPAQGEGAVRPGGAGAGAAGARQRGRARGGGDPLFCGGDARGARAAAVAGDADCAAPTVHALATCR
eukprot:scaffold24405_cov60-Phaeocystis_antarctica.AAC.5